MSYSHDYLKAFQELAEGTLVSGCEGDLDLGRGLDECERLTAEAKASGGRLFFCGNGASAAFSSHMALDWSKNGGVPAISLNDSVQLTALGNDLGYDDVFAAALQWHARSGDLLVTISSSGNSPNIIKAIGVAREIGMKVITFSGLKPDNESRKLGDLNVYVPAKTYGMVECAHLVGL